PLVTRVGLHAHHLRALAARFLPGFALLHVVDAVAFHLHARAGFAGAPLDAAVAHQVEGGDALGDPRRVVVPRRHQRDAVAEPDALRALAAGGDADLWRRGGRVLLEDN